MVRRAFFNIYIDSIKDLHEFDFDSIENGSQIVSLNLDILIRAKNDANYAEIIRQSELIFADGAIISLSSAIFFAYHDINKVAGVDFAKKLLEKKKKIVLLGSSEENISILQEEFPKNYPEKEFFFHHGYFSDGEEEKIFQKIENFSPDLILFALGAPRQEKLIYKYKKIFANAVMMGVGGSFDIWSGKLKRAPNWMVKTNLEWFFRIIQEPSRINRFLYNVSQYIVLLMSSLFGERYGK